MLHTENGRETCKGPEVEGVVILEFPFFAEAKAWYDSPAYREVREHRFRGADYRSVIVEGRDLDQEPSYW